MDGHNYSWLQKFGEGKCSKKTLLHSVSVNKRKVTKSENSLWGWSISRICYGLFWWFFGSWIRLQLYRCFVIGKFLCFIRNDKKKSRDENNQISEYSNNYNYCNTHYFSEKGKMRCVKLSNNVMIQFNNLRKIGQLYYAVSLHFFLKSGARLR